MTEGHAHVREYYACKYLLRKIIILRVGDPQYMWMWQLLFAIHVLNDSLDFKESLEVVDLSKGHSNEEEGLKHWPPHHSWVSVVIDCREREREREDVTQAFNTYNNPREHSLILCILSLTSMYSCSCLITANPWANSPTISSNLLCSGGRERERERA